MAVETSTEQMLVEALLESNRQVTLLAGQVEQLALQLARAEQRTSTLAQQQQQLGQLVEQLARSWAH